MSRKARIINISEVQSLVDFLRLAEEVQKTKEPTVLRRDGEDLVELRPAKPAKKAGARGKVFTKDDPLWDIVGLLKDDGGPTDVSANVDKYLAEAYADTHE